MLDRCYPIFYEPENMTNIFVDASCRTMTKYNFKYNTVHTATNYNFYKTASSSLPNWCTFFLTRRYCMSGIMVNSVL